MRRIVLLIVPLLVFACDRQPAAPDIAPTLDIANAPPFSGVVWRGETWEALTWADPKTGMRLSVGYDPVADCSGDFEPLSWLSFQALDLPSRLGLLELGTAQASVWGFTEYDCDLFSSEQPLAIGEAHFRYTDNDFFWSGENNANAWGFLVNGTLVASDGGAAQLAAHLRAVSGKGIKSATVKLQ